MSVGLICCGVLSSSTVALEGMTFDYLRSIGVGSLQRHDRQVNGQTVSMALVELSQGNGYDPLAYDFVPNIEHKSLAHVRWRDFYYVDDPNRPIQYSSHASAIAGILLGWDDAAFIEGIGSFRFQGIAPNLEVDIYEANWFLFKQVLASAPNFMDCDIVTMSWGTEADNPFTMWWQRGIDALAERDKIVMVAGCGNGTDGNINTISKPSWGYNVISVGVARGLGTFPDCMIYQGTPIRKYSNWGPTDEGRVKPDVIAPGMFLAPSIDSSRAYNCVKQAVGFSSYAAPQVAGVAALLIDAARQNDIVHGDDPRVVKALILNGANKLTGWHKGTCDPADDHSVPLDYRQGAGMINAWNSYRQLLSPTDPYWFDDPNYVPGNIGWILDRVSLDEADPNSEKIYLMPESLQSNTDFKATLCWNRHYKDNRLFESQPLNFLALELWSVDSRGKLQSRLDYSDSIIDNVQHIWYHNNVSQRVALVVTGAGEDPNHFAYENFGLAWCDEQENWPGDQMSGDFNADGIVDVRDVVRFIDIWGKHEESPDRAREALRSRALSEDVDGDGRITAEDYDLLSRQWQRRSAWHRPEP